jgi:hypothetical protein
MGGKLMRLPQQVRIRPVGDDFAFASVVVDGWSVHGVRVPGDRIEWPESEKNGRRYPIVTPPPEIRDQLEAEIATAYEMAIASRGGR